MALTHPWIRDRLDRVGITLSGLCLVHCLAGLLLVTVLGVGGQWILDPAIHRVGLALAIAVGCGREPMPPALTTAASLRLTEGTARPSGGSIAITEPSVRGVVPESTGDAAALDLVYLGPTSETATLASGAERSQLGLKLRAQDSCNVIYVMWRIEPVSATNFFRESLDTHR